MLQIHHFYNLILEYDFVYIFLTYHSFALTYCALGQSVFITLLISKSLYNAGKRVSKDFTCILYVYPTPPVHSVNEF